MQEHGAVMHAVVARLVLPCVAMRIEMHQRERPVLLRMRLEQRVGDEMVAAQRDHCRAVGDDAGGMLFDGCRHLVRKPEIPGAIAAVDDPELVERIEILP
jgi:hypothetical protein